MKAGQMHACRHWFVISLLFTVFLVSTLTHLLVQVSSVTAAYVLPAPADRHLYITLASTAWWGCGNQLFGFAAMVGVANTHNHTWQPCLPEKVEIRKIFDLSWVRNCSASSLGAQRSVFREKLYAVYDQRSESLPRHSSLVLGGYFQSWRYFAQAQDDLRQYLQLRPQVQQTAHSLLSRMLQQHFNCTSCVQHKLVIGVHIRQGDMARKSAKKFGYKVAPIGYVHRAMSYMLKHISSQSTLPSEAEQHAATSVNTSRSSNVSLMKNSAASQDTASDQNHVFVVCSDDINWSRKNLGSRSDVVYLTQHSNQRHRGSWAYPEDVSIDLAALSMCNHTIMTVGTFGWWAGYLAGGTTVYYKDWPANNSHLWNTTSHRDYFPTNWIGLK